MPDVIPDVDAIPDQPQEMYFVKRSFRWLNDRLQELKTTVDGLKSVDTSALTTQAADLEKRVGVLEREPDPVVATPATAKMGGRIKTFTNTVTITSTSLQVVYSTTLDANELDVDEDWIEFDVWGRGLAFDGGVSTIQVTFELGASSIDLDYNGNPNYDQYMSFNGKLIRTGAATQRGTFNREGPVSLTFGDWGMSANLAVANTMRIRAKSSSGAAVAFHGCTFGIMRQKRTVNIP